MKIVVIDFLELEPASGVFVVPKAIAAVHQEKENKRQQQNQQQSTKRFFDGWIANGAI